MTSSFIVKPCVKCGATERYASGRCKPCQNLRVTAYNAANYEKLKACGAAWKAANKDRRKAVDAAYRAANYEKCRAKTEAWAKANLERKRASVAAWAKANPEACRIKDQNRAARKRQNGGTLSRGLAEKLFKLQKGKCACCGLSLGDDYHLDHIMPIALGGPNIDSNIQLLRRRCNHQKSAKHPIDFMQSKGLLI